MKVKTLLTVALASTILLAYGCEESGGDDDTQQGDSDANPVNKFTPLPDDEPSSKIDDILGVSVHTCWSQSEGCTEWREFELSKLEEAGVAIVRRDLSWSLVEPQPDEYDLTGPRTLIEAAANHGIELIALLDYCNSWACEDGFTSSIDVEAFAQYAGTIAAEFADELTYYEVWNEENIVRFWKPQPDPYKYGELLKAAYKAIKEADEDSLVLFGGLAPAYELSMFPHPHGIWGFYYKVKYYHPDVDDYFDIFAIHPYVLGQHGAPEWEIPGLEIFQPSVEQMIEYAQQMTKKPVWITEIGWPSLYLSEEIQAAYLARSFIISAHDKAKRVLWYTTWDGTGGTTEDRFGLFGRIPGEPAENQPPKPAYFALKALHELVGDTRPSEEVSANLGLYPWERAYLFVDDGGGPCAVAVWSIADNDRRDATLDIPYSDGPFDAYDMLGNPLDAEQSENGEITIEISNYPVYIILW